MNPEESRGKSQRGRARRRSDEIEKGLREIYENPEVGSQDLTTFTRGPGLGRWLMAAGIIFFVFLAAAAWAGFYIFRPAEKFAGENIDLTITAAEELTSGAVSEFVINYGNRETVPLGAVEISLAYSKEFKLIETEPASPEANSWRIGSLPKGGEGHIKLSGAINAPKGKAIAVSAYLTYKPANFNSEFQKVANASFNVAKSMLALEVEGPERAVPGEEIQYLVKYQNNSGAKLERTEIRAFYAENFFPKKAAPAPAEGEGRWLLPALADGEKGEIKITGSFSSTAEGTRQSSFEAGKANEDGIWLPMERVASSAELVKSELKLILVGNGGGGGAVNFGDTLRYSLFFENRSQMALSDIILSLRLEGSPAVGGRSPLVWETISDEAGAKRTGDTLTWTKKQISALGRLEPGEQGTADIAIELVPVPFSKGGTDYKVVAFGEAKIGKIGGARSDRVARSEPLEMKLFSDLVFIAEGRYYDDDDNAVGAGPAPPRVGETTFYRIWWTLANTLHDLEELKVESVLPPGVNFTGRFNSEDAGELSYDEKTRKVVWKIEKLKGAKEPVRAEFEVSITPAEDQLGSTVVLTDLASASGRDTALDALIFRTVPQITSNIETDPNLAGKGTVRR